MGKTKMAAPPALPKANPLDRFEGDGFKFPNHDYYDRHVVFDHVVPMANATHAAAVADAGPAEEPLDPCDGFHGLFVRPRNH